MFIRFLTSIINHTKCISLNKQQCMIRSTLTNLIPNEYSQQLCYYPFVVNLSRCARSCNILNDLSSKVCVPKKQDLSLSISNMITGINESKISTKHANVNVNLMAENVTQIKSEITVNVVASVEIRKNMRAKKIIFGIPATCTCKNGKYVGNIIGDSVITCDEIIEATKSTSTEIVPAKSISKKAVPTKVISTNFFILLVFLLMTMALMIAANVT